MITHGWQNSTVLHDSGNKLARIRYGCNGLLLLDMKV